MPRESSNFRKLIRKLALQSSPASPIITATQMGRTKHKKKKVVKSVRFAEASIAFSQRPRTTWKNRARARANIEVSVRKFDDILRGRELAKLLLNVRM